jgi:hypothetical protein
MTPAFLIAAVMVVMMAIYSVIHRLFPSWGTVLTNAVAGLAMLVDYAQLLPWGTVLDAHQAALVGFAIAAANGLMRLKGPKASVGQGEKS